MVRPTLLAIIWVLTSGTALSARGDEIDQYLRAQMQIRHVQGVSVAVVKNGKVIKTAGYGLANVENRSAAAPGSVYELGSVTKQFTSAAIMLLVQDGKMSIDDKLVKYFPDAPPAWGNITVRHVLTHTSGIQNHVAVPGFIKKFKTDVLFETSPSRDEAVKMFLQLPIEFKPGETWAYDNTGYYLLGMLIERVSGKPYFQFLNERIFLPLGMATTGSTDPRYIVPNRASGYEWVAGHFENRSVLMPGIAFSAGSLVSTVGDMAKWDAALYTNKIVNADSQKQMWTAARGNGGEVLPFDYGFGWFTGNYRGRRLVHHTGGTPGFSSAFYRFVDDGLSVIILANHSDTIIDHWAIDIAAMHIPALRRKPLGKESDPVLSNDLREQLTALGRSDPGTFALTDAMKLFTATATGKTMFGWYVAGGPIGRMELTSIENQLDGTMLRYSMHIGRNVSEVSFLLTRDKKIGQILWW